MTTYVRYELDDGSEILVEAGDEEGIIKAVRGAGEHEMIQADTRFRAALSTLRSTARALIAEIESLQVEEAEVRFGLKTTGEAGLFAIGKVGGEVNYEVTLRWKNSNG